MKEYFPKKWWKKNKLKKYKLQSLFLNINFREFINNIVRDGSR